MASNTAILQSLSEERRAALGPQFGIGSPIGGHPAPTLVEVPVPDIDITESTSTTEDTELLGAQPVVEPDPEPVVESVTKGDPAPSRRAATSSTKAGPAKA